MIRVPPLPPDPTKGAAAVVPARQWPPWPEPPVEPLVYDDMPPVVVDSREPPHTAYRFFGKAGTVRKKLDSGDYSILGMETVCAVERKQYSDIWGTVGHGRERFLAELERLRTYPYRAVVLEAHWARLLLDPPPEQRPSDKHGRKLHPNALVGSLMAWQWDYQIPIIAAGYREMGQRITAWLLHRAWKKHDAHNRALLAAERAAEKPDAGQ